ncbi:hypothetical protein WJX77_008447 [Trebouxia sp. C0004]
MEDLDKRRVAIQQLQLVRRFAHQDREPCAVLPGLYIGPIGAARNLESLQKNGVTHVLNASPVIPCFHKRQLRYKKLLVYDDPDDDIARFFDESSRFIQKARKKGGVLVHCFAGQSRSAALVAAYLISYEGLDPGAALHLIRQEMGRKASAMPIFQACLEAVDKVMGP